MNEIAPTAASRATCPRTSRHGSASAPAAITGTTSTTAGYLLPVPSPAATAAAYSHARFPER